MKAALALLEKKRPILERVVPTTLQDQFTWESTRAQVAMALSNSNALAGADPKSVYASVLYILSHGLEIGGSAQQAFLVPFKGKCVPMIGAQGKIELAMRSGRIDNLTVQAVYTNDVFEVDFLRPESNTHRPARGDRGDIEFVYAAIWVKGASIPLLELMYEDDFAQIREEAKRKNRGKLSPAYQKWPLEMWRRSCLNRALKRAPKSKDLWEMLATETRLDEGGTVAAKTDGHVTVIDAEEDFDLEAPALPDNTDADAIEELDQVDDREPLTVDADAPVHTYDDEEDP